MRAGWPLAVAMCLAAAIVPSGASAAPTPSTPPQYHPPTIYPPSGGASPKGTVLILCCGGWSDPRPEIDIDANGGAATRVPFFRTAGYRVANFGYGDGWYSVQYALRAMNEVRQQFPNEKICIYGESAAGHVGLMVAAVEGAESRGNDPDGYTGPDCVIAEGSPSHLPGLQGYDKDGPGGPLPANAGYNLAVEAFESQIGLYSPWYWSPDIAASVISAICAEDWIVPPSNALAMASGLRQHQAGKPWQSVYGTSLPGPLVPAAQQNFVHHCQIPEPQYSDYLDARVWFLDNSARVPADPY